MNLFIGFIAQLVHIMLMVAAAPLIAGIRQWLAARLAGRAGASVLQPWRDLRRVARKQVVLAEGASGVTAIAPVVCVASTALAAALVPSFALGMSFAGVADLLVIGALLAAARGALALAAMDAGSAPGGLAASRAMLLACLAGPSFLLVAFVLAILAGSLNVDLIAAMQVENGTAWHIGTGIALVALMLIASVDHRRDEALAQELSGPDLALVEAADALRLLVWFDLIGATFLPFGIAPAAASPLIWPLGLACWLGRTLLFVAALAVMDAVLGRVRWLGTARTLGVAGLLGLLAAVSLFAAMRAA